MMFFKKKSEKRSYDKECKKPVIKASICNGEQVVGFKDLKTGTFEEITLILLLTILRGGLFLLSSCISNSVQIVCS